MASPWMSLYRRAPRLARRNRRIAVAAAFIGFPAQQAGYALLVAPGHLGTLAWAPLSIVLFTASIVGVLAIYGYGQGRIDRHADLDERQRAMVDRALIASYGVLTTIIVVAGGIVATYASFVGPVVIEMGASTPWLIGIGLYIPSLPFAALAWFEPDPPADDDDR